VILPLVAQESGNPVLRAFPGRRGDERTDFPEDLCHPAAPPPHSRLQGGPQTGSRLVIVNVGSIFQKSFDCMVFLSFASVSSEYS